MAIPKILGAQRDFSAGEVDVTFKRADDRPARKTGVRQCANFRILNSGSVQNRSGRRALFPAIGRTEKILVAPGVYYYLSFGNTTLTIHDITGAVVTFNGGYLWTPATAKSIIFCLCPRGVAGIDVVMTFPGQAPQIARYSAGAWTFLPFAFLQNGAGGLLEPFLRIADPGVTLTPSAETGSVSLLTSAPYFVAGVWPNGMVGTTIRWQQCQIIITAVTDSEHATGTVIEQLPNSDKTVVNGASLIGYFSVGDIAINALGVEAEIAFAGSGFYFVNYLKTGTRWNTAGDNIEGPTGFASITIPNGEPPQASTIWDEEIMSGFRGWPTSCFFDQGRLGFCNFPAVPRGLAYSTIGVPNNFFVGATPSAAIFELLPNNSQVLYVLGGAEGNEFVFCDNAIYYIPISVVNPLTPTSIAFNLLSDDGSANVQPRATQDVIVYVNAGGNTMKAIQAIGAYQRPFNTANLNEFCSHLLNSVVAIAAPRADASFQERYIYVLNGDGTMAVGKYTVEQGQIKGIVGWAPFSGAGSLQWISAQQADMFFTTAYTPNGIGAVTVVEVLDDTQYLDCAIPVQNVPAPFVTAGKGPLFAFANGSVTLMDQVTRMMGTYFIDANGNIIPQNNGGENLLAATLIAGQPWTATLEPFVPDAQPGQAMSQRMFKRRVSRMAAAVAISTGFLMARLFSGPITRTSPPPGTVMNSYRVTTWNQDDDPTLAPPLRATVERWRPIGRSFDPRVAIIKDTPGPLRVEELGLEATI